MTALPDLPVLGVCGWSGAGKTTLLEAVLPTLTARGLSVAVVKHDAHGVNVDRPGKDSDRLFRAGADVFLTGDQHFQRLHISGREKLAPRLMELSRRYDLVLVEGHKGSEVPKIWLPGENNDAPPSEAREVLAVLPRDSERPARFLALLDDWLPRQWRKPPVWGCLLIGGKSSRMGRPKHLITTPEGCTWLERNLAALREVTRGVVVAGAGELPASLAREVAYRADDAPANAQTAASISPLLRLPDSPGVAGPLAGLLAALRYHPAATWLVAACDMPALSAAALRWLLDRRAPGAWAVLPRCGDHGVEPLLALYDSRAATLLETLAVSGPPRMQDLAAHPKVLSPAPPPGLLTSWQNINTPDELETLHNTT